MTMIKLIVNLVFAIVVFGTFLSLLVWFWLEIFLELIDVFREIKDKWEE